MKYNSTRGTKNLSFKDAFLSGFTDDGGLTVPSFIPKLSKEEIKSMASKEYQEICFEILKRFISEEEIPHHTLKEIIYQSLENVTIPK